MLEALDISFLIFLEIYDCLCHFLTTNRQGS